MSSRTRPRRRDADPDREEYEAFLRWRQSQQPDDDDDDLDDEEPDDDGPDDRDGGAYIFHGRQADSFLDRFFGPEPGEEKPRRRARRDEPAGDPDDSADVDDEPPADDPAPPRGPRFFR